MMKRPSSTGMEVRPRPIRLITAIRAAKPCNDNPGHGRGLIGPFLGVGRMAALPIRRPWARAILAVLDALLIASAALLLVKPSTHTTTFLAQVAGLPPGAASCQVVYTQIKAPFNAGARGTPLTSCAFVEQVRRTAQTEHLSASSPPTQLRVVSPTTRKQYEMQCVSAESYVTCTGGQDAIVYLYRS